MGTFSIWEHSAVSRSGSSSPSAIGMASRGLDIKRVHCECGGDDKMALADHRGRDSSLRELDLLEWTHAVRPEDSLI